MKKSKLLPFGIALLVLAAFVGGRALATGSPTQTPLTWSGTITDETGAPYTTPVSVTVAFYDSPTATLSKCTSPTGQAAANTGRFAVVLPADCATAIHSAQDLWTEATVGPSNVVLPRVHVGAVPYALESDSATVANSANNVTCVGCITVPKMTFDQDVSLNNHNLTAGTGTLTAQTVSTGAAGANLTTGTLDLGPTTGDELTSAEVKTLTGGGNADALHTHAGLGGTTIKFKGVTSVSFKGAAGVATLNAQCATDYGAARACTTVMTDGMFPAPVPSATAWILADGVEIQSNQNQGATTTHGFYVSSYNSTWNCSYATSGWFGSTFGSGSTIDTSGNFSITANCSNAYPVMCCGL